MSGVRERDRKDEPQYPVAAAPRLLVTLHLPLEMHCVAMVLSAVAESYPNAVMGEGGQVLCPDTDDGVELR